MRKYSSLLIWVGHAVISRRRIILTIWSGWGGLIKWRGMGYLWLHRGKQQRDLRYPLHSNIIGNVWLNKSGKKYVAKTYPLLFLKSCPFTLFRTWMRLVWCVLMVCWKLLVMDTRSTMTIMLRMVNSPLRYLDQVVPGYKMNLFVLLKMVRKQTNILRHRNL